LFHRFGNQVKHFYAVVYRERQIGNVWRYDRHGLARIWLLSLDGLLRSRPAGERHSARSYSKNVSEECSSSRIHVFLPFASLELTWNVQR
jgi:hypothetical protein